MTSHDKGILTDICTGVSPVLIKLIGTVLGSSNVRTIPKSINSVATYTPGAEKFKHIQ